MVSRRSFLKSCSTAALTAFASSSALRRAWADPLGLPIGIELYTVGEPMKTDAPGVIKQIAAIGFKEVETAGFGSLQTAAAMRKVLDDNGLKCPSAHLRWNLKDLGPTLDDANALGCTYATASVPWSMLAAEAGHREPVSPDDFKNLAEAMNTAGAAAKKAGLKFAAHNHTMEFVQVDGRPGYDFLLEHTDPSLVWFEIDCGWMTVAGHKPGDYMRRYPGRIKMLHIKDFSSYEPGKAGRSAIGTEIGKGKVDYKEIFAAARGQGVEHIFLEQEAPFTMPQIEAAKQSYDYVHSLK